MGYKIYVLGVLILLASCGTKKRNIVRSKQYKVTVEATTKDSIPKTRIPKRILVKERSSKADAIINTALTFSGVRYKYGGTTTKGMDCSGLLFVSFSQNNIALPRVSTAMAKKGKKVKVKNVAKGDLLFFKTKKGKKINHVGMVVSVTKKEIKFIHASSSRGVIVSSLREGYWNYAFVMATRVL